VNHIPEANHFTKNRNQIDSSLIDNNNFYVKVSVTDTGVGIKKEEQCKLFKLFGYLAGANGMNTHGIGLGLVISQKICEKFEGKITIYSEFGVGSEFSYFIKLNTAEILREKNAASSFIEDNLPLYEIDSDKLYQYKLLNVDGKDIDIKF